MSKPIVLLGDMGLDHEGFPPTPVTAGSPDVFVDGKPVARVGDPLAPHSKPKHPPHPRLIASGSTTVLINGVPAAITGGTISCGGVTMGSGSVVIGDTHTPHPVSPPTPFPARNPAAVDPDDPDEGPAASASSASASSSATPATPRGASPAAPSTSTPSPAPAAAAAPIATADTAQETAEPGFHIVQQAMSKNELLGQLYGDASLKPDRFDQLNPGLGNRVKAGQMIVLGDPEGMECTREESQLMEAAELVNAQVNQLSEEEAQFAVDYFDLIEAVTSTSTAGVGAGAVMVSKQLDGIKANLKELEDLHKESYRKHGNLSNPEFFEKRRAIFKRLDFSLGSLARKGLSLDDSSKLKRALKLSSKSIVHSWDKAGVGDIPGYATHYDRVNNGAKYMRTTGYLVIGLDVTIAGMKIKEACEAGADSTQVCEQVVYRQSGRVSGSVGGGAIGATSAAACGLIGLASGGVGGLVCAIIVGGAGSAAGSYAGGQAGENLGERVYQWVSSDD